MTFDRAIDAIGEQAARVVPIMERVITDASQDMLREVRDGWPVDSGRSMLGWSSTVDGLEIEIVNTVGYAAFVHDGASAAAAEADIIRVSEELAETISRQSVATLDLE